ncbi:glycoside hydrolase [Paraflavitalea soli]|uniref:Glycoside hydrolase n=1 Tax=Paraflavitalea soli TaxID=2315862 RepID=A0A3B7MPX9_9BACT|nr:family 43 glycosylhydrolase [Paraflavitalea soli]AXY75373.1 glycoside hydrolase [Paraflavitalea soli]
MVLRSIVCLCTALLLGTAVLAQSNNKGPSKKAAHEAPYEAYLFAYFTGNDKSEEQIRFALSKDGYHYQALNGDQPIIASSAISSTGGVRDPHILRGADNKTFYLVATDMVSAKGWNSNRAMVLLKSTDLIHWTSAVVNIQQRFAGHDSLLRVWAPQTIYDAATDRYLIYFSMKHGHDPDKIYYAYANKDFTDLATEPTQLFVEPGNGACIDGDIVHKDGKYYLFFKTEGARTAGLKVAVSDKLTAGYVLRDEYIQQTTDPVEGAGVFKLNNSNDYILMYDVYTKGKYQFTKTSDLEHFKIVDEGVTMNFHPRHGTIISITAAEADRLNAQWGSVRLQGAHNPVLDGKYADPDILYSEKTKKYYIYPTSDGFTGWSGTYFKTFSSTDLVQWKDEGVILDLPRDVRWGNRNAWAPTITEKKINGQYKYFYYFTAAQKIGVAVSDAPTGPFVDAGKPLIDQRPEGVKGGQQIDPDVFTDPKTGKSYLYWGNGYMAGAELNEDMVSIKPGTTQILTPDGSFREGTHVLYRKGVYYFLWSENDTRDADYRVRYGRSDAPLGKITVPANNLVIAKDTAQGIYATGHNSTIQVPGKDEWYIVYHRFSYPNGINLGKAAGYNREVCIDKMEFNPDGSIRQVQPTHKGVRLKSPARKPAARPGGAGDSKQ